MPPIAFGRLKPVSNLERTYGLRMPVLCGWGRRRFWLLLRLLSTIWISYNEPSLTLSSAASDQGVGAANGLQGVGDMFG
jgi:hypothetical protein